MNPLDLLYPAMCHGCERALENGRYLCADCSETYPRVASPFCDVCGESFPGQIDGSFECPNCAGLSFHFEFARAAMDRCPEVLEMVHALKYQREIHLARELALLACEAFSDKRLSLAMENGWPLVPVPLHRSRERERHFNQAAEIARVIGQETGLPVQHRLKRIRKTATQTRLTRNERMENLKHAFAARKPWRPWTKAEGIILIDDVFTTGSTVDACAKILQASGIPRVAVLTVMRG